MAALAPDTTIRMLLERLNWPVRLVKWRAAREYGALLASPIHAIKALEIFTRWLSSRQLESEVISGLTTLLSMRKAALPDFGKVVPAIQRPSLLADQMLELAYGTAR
jgi:hypothetical protein